MIRNKIPPSIILLFLLIFIIFVSATILYKITYLPWMGVQFSPNKNDTQGITVKSIHPTSPNLDLLKKNQNVIAISSVLTPEITEPLTNSSLKPLLNFPTTQQYKIQLQQHQKIFQILKEGQARLFLDNGENRIITLQNYRPFSSIPWIFKIFLLTNYLGIILGFIVWTRRPKERTGIMLLIMGVAYYITTSSSILMISEIAIHSAYAEIFPLVLSFSLVIIGLSLISILAYFPKNIFPTHYVYLLYAIIIFIFIISHILFINLPLHTFYFCLLILFPLSIFQCYKQWKAATNPLDRATCLAFLLPIIVFAIPATALFILPVVFHKAPIIDKDSAKLLLGTIFIGFTIAIMKYRLFDVEKWWFKTWLWLISGILVIFIDLLLVFTLDVNETTALGIAAIVIGFIYFPLRQWLFQKLLPPSEKPINDYLPIFMQHVNDTINLNGFEKSWKDILIDRYSALNIQYSKDDANIKLINNGLDILIPSISPSGHYQLTGKNGGLRLFNKKDCKDIEALHHLINSINQTTQKQRTLIIEERQKIMQDLHDSVGSNLLSLSQRIKEPTAVKCIAETLQTLRDTIHLSTSETPLWMQDIVADLRIEVIERCELAQTALSWQSDELPDDAILSIAQSIALINIIREAISNALRHASPSKIEVQFIYIDNTIEVKIKNNGYISNRNKWKYGNGLNGMRLRTEKLDGTFRIDAQKNYVQIFITLPIGKQTKK